MSGFDLTWDALAEATRATNVATERLTDDRRRISAEVGALLDGWRGQAADSFRDCWAEWQAGCADVVEGLEAMGMLLIATRMEYQQQDAQSQRTLDQVSGLILERLG